MHIKIIYVEQMVDVINEKKIGVKQIVEIKNKNENNRC